MNQLESWIYLKIGQLEFLVVFAAFIHIAGFFEQSNHLHILVSVFCLFLHFSLMLPLPLYENILICIFGMCIFLALSLPFQFFFSVLSCKQVFSFSFHTHLFGTKKLIFSNNLTYFLNSVDKMLGSL